VPITSPLAGEIGVKASSSHLAKAQSKTWYLIGIGRLSYPVPDFEARVGRGEHAVALLLVIGLPVPPTAWGHSEAMDQDGDRLNNSDPVNHGLFSVSRTISQPLPALLSASKPA
jgi:hypothetical protein